MSAEAQPRNFRGGAKAFWTQYISLMLVILTGVVGSFTSRSLAAGAGVPKKISPAPETRKTIKPQSIVNFEFRDLFKQRSALLLTAKLETLISLLKSHDLLVAGEISVAGTEVSSGQKGALLIARVSSLSQALLKAGLPAEAVNLTSSEKSSDLQARLSIYRIASERR